MTSPTAGPTDVRERVARLYRRPLLDLVREASAVHVRHHDPAEVQCATLLSVKTGACPEDCAYCPQSSRYRTAVEREELVSVDAVVTAATRARDGGADRFCMGAAWRDAKDGPDFDRVLDMVRAVKDLGLETCATLGMVTSDQATRLADAGLDYYNHNLDSSREFYGSIIGTRTYDDRLRTLRTVRDVGMKVCCGGILGMGETDEDRIGLLAELAGLDPPPESVPVNALVPVAGTPLADRPPVDWDVVVRTIAAARILMPASRVRLSAGRAEMSESTQALCFLAGANSIFFGDRLLTTPNPNQSGDEALLRKLGLRTRSSVAGSAEQ